MSRRHVLSMTTGRSFLPIWEVRCFWRNSEEKRGLCFLRRLNVGVTNTGSLSTGTGRRYWSNEINSDLGGVECSFGKMSTAEAGADVAAVSQPAFVKNQEQGKNRMAGLINGQAVGHSDEGESYQSKKLAKLSKADRLAKSYRQNSGMIIFHCPQENKHSSANCQSGIFN